MSPDYRQTVAFLNLARTLGPVLKVNLLTTLPHVFVDATSIPRDRGGVGRYLEGLIPALETTGLPLTIAVQQHAANWMRSIAPESEVTVPSTNVSVKLLRFLWEQFGLPRAARQAKADLIFSPHYTMPLATSRPVVVTLHDATFFTHPELHRPIKRRFFTFWIRRSLARAALCIVPSDATRIELERVTRVRDDQIRVAHLGVNTEIFHAPTDAERQSAREITGTPHWISFLGTLEPRKNVASLVAAFDEIANDPRITSQYPNISLALAGGKGWDETLASAIATARCKDRILMLGFVANEALSGLLGESLVTVYPSLGEGFGLPVLEAMACGSPIITTRLLSLPEVGGDVAIYSEPDHVSIAASLGSLLLDEPERASRSRRGLERAALFSWDNCARVHIDSFATAAAR